MKSFHYILSTHLHRLLLGLALALCLGAPAIAAPPADEAGCKVWNVQLGSSVFAIPHTPSSLGVHVDVGGDPNKSSWLHDHTRCDSAPLNVRHISFLIPYPVRQRGVLPEPIRLYYPARSPDDISSVASLHRVDRSLVKTRCRDGFDTEIAKKAFPISRVFGCYKESGRLLLWDCQFPSGGRDDGTCIVHDNVGPVTLSYRWDRELAGHERAPQLDDAVIDYLNNLIVSGEKLPR